MAKTTDIEATVRAELTARPLSTAEAEAAGLTRDQVWRFRTGERPTMKVATFVRLCGALGFDLTLTKRKGGR